MTAAPRALAVRPRAVQLARRASGSELNPRSPPQTGSCQHPRLSADPRQARVWKMLINSHVFQMPRRVHAPPYDAATDLLARGCVCCRSSSCLLGCTNQHLAAASSSIGPAAAASNQNEQLGWIHRPPDGRANSRGQGFPAVSPDSWSGLSA